MFARGAADFSEGIRSVLEGRLPRFSLEYAIDGVVIAHTDITEREHTNQTLNVLSLVVEQSLELAPRERDYLLKIHSASESLLSLVNDILDFSKRDADRRPTQR